MPQGITPQADDGTVIARGTIDGHPVVIAAIEQGFQGGGTGEVSGAKISQALLLAAADSRAGTPTAAVILFETGGVRLQEANLGLNAVAEICSAATGSAPAGTGHRHRRGHRRIIRRDEHRRRPVHPADRHPAGPHRAQRARRHRTGGRRRRIRLQRPRADLGGRRRRAASARPALADALVPDDADLLRAALVAAVAAGVTEPGQHRSERLDVLASRLATLDPADHPSPGRPAPALGCGLHAGPRARCRAGRASRRPPRHPRPDLARRAQRWRHPRADHPVGPVGDVRTPPAISPSFPIPTTGSTAPARDRSG